MTTDREPIKTSAPTPDCTCDWALVDSGTMAVRQRIREDPTCPIHRKNKT